MTEETPVINEIRNEVRLGELILKYERVEELVEVGRVSPLSKKDYFFAQIVDFSLEMWESFVGDLEEKMATGLAFSALKQIRQMGDFANKIKSQEEAGLRESKLLRPGVEAFMQFGVRVEALVSQVLEEVERTSPEQEDERHVSILDASTAPRGIMPPEIADALDAESQSSGARVSPLNWQVTGLGDVRIVFLVYAYADGDRQGIRYAVHIDGSKVSSGVVS